MILQKTIIQNYLDLIGTKKTLKEMSEDLGINITRVFRLLQGHQMKLSEYEKFKKFISMNDKSSHDLVRLSELCVDRLSRSSLKNIEILLQRKLSLWELVQKPQENILTQMTA